MNLALAQRYHATNVALQNRIALAALALWARQPPLTDAQLDQFTALTVPLVTGAQTQSITVAATYIGTYAGTPAPVDVAAIRASLRDGADPIDVYSRPTITLRTLLSEGVPYTDATARAGARLDATVRTDMQLAARGGQHAAMQASPHIVGYRRICGGKPCLLCLSASTQRYHARDLMPIHARCYCTVAPIVGESDPGHVIDEQLLEQLKSNDYLGHLHTGTTTPTLDQLRGQFVTHEHGELGPVLAIPGQHFDGPDSIAA